MEQMTNVSLVSLNGHLAEALSDPIDIRGVVLGEAGEMAGALAGLGKGLCNTRTILLNADAIPMSEADRAALLRAATLGVRIVSAGAKPLTGFPPMMVLHEPDFYRALVASVYSLPPGAAMLVATRCESDLPRLRGRVHHAMRWRKCWSEPEEGDFLSNPV